MVSRSRHVSSRFVSTSKSISDSASSVPLAFEPYRTINSTGYFCTSRFLAASIAFRSLALSEICASVFIWDNYSFSTGCRIDAWLFGGLRQKSPSPPYIELLPLILAFSRKGRRNPAYVILPLPNAINIESMQTIDTLINARWVIPVEPDGLTLDHHSIAVHGGKIGRAH